jgi:hypothetical protein
LDHDLAALIYGSGK